MPYYLDDARQQDSIGVLPRVYGIYPKVVLVAMTLEKKPHDWIRVDETPDQWTYAEDMKKISDGEAIMILFSSECGDTSAVPYWARYKWRLYRELPPPTSHIPDLSY